MNPPVRTAGAAIPYDEFSERYRLALKDHATWDAERRRLEKMEKIVFSEIVNQSTASSVTKAEHEARAAARYKAICADLANATTAANLANAEVKAMELKFEMWRTRNANRRQEMKQLGG